jgi:YYY domain-containing protein
MNMGSDFSIVVQWWGTLFLIGAVAFPLTKTLFPSWYDRGYFFAKAVGMAVVTYAVYLLGMLHVAPFTTLTIFWTLLGVFIVGIGVEYFRRGQASHRGELRVSSSVKKQWIANVALVGLQECFFFGALLFWSWVKGHEASIRGLEKFMDYGFTQSILNSTWFPAVDMWYASYPINYYYFGHTVMAVLTKLSGLDLSVAFNLMLVTLFALCLTMSFSIGYQLARLSPLGAGVSRWVSLAAGVLTAFLVTLAGNMQTLYAFTKGYTGENVQPFWQLLWSWSEIGTKLSEGIERYWYANATRFIPFTIHEFPSYSFVVSDVHGHVLSIPFVLLAIALLIKMVSQSGAALHTGSVKVRVTDVLFYGFLCGVLLMTNALDGPIYFGLFGIVFLVVGYKHVSRADGRKYMGIVGGALIVGTIVASAPFLSHFTSFVSGVAVNCPPSALSNTKIGILLFEEVEKCQRSPVWMMWLLWGFFWFCGVGLLLWKMGKKLNAKGISHIWSTKFTQHEQLLTVFFFFSLGLLIFPELFYFKDIYPAHFRSNTMFKLGYQAFILCSILSGYVIVQIAASSLKHKLARWGRKLFMLLLVPQLFLVSIYPFFAVRSYFGGLRQYSGIDGLTWMKTEYPDDYTAMLWLRQHATRNKQQVCKLMSHVSCFMSPVIVEADGDSYTDYARFSAFTGLPTIIGWPVHEWLWRGTYDVVAPRREDVRLLYESADVDQTKRLLDLYAVQYVLVGTLEREKYPLLLEDKWVMLGDRVFESGNTAIYQMR